MNTATLVMLVAMYSALASGCASTSPEKSFQGLSQQVEKQSGHHVRWDQAGDDDKKVSDEITKLLAKEEMTVDQTVAVVLLNNPSLQATYEELSLAQADVVQAGLLRNPVFSASITTAEREAIDPNVIFGVTQDFLDLLMIPARKKVARAQLEQVRLRLVDEVLDAASRTRATYFTLQSAMQVTAMREAIAKAADATMELMVRQHEVGNINDLELANETTLYEQIKLDLAQSQLDVVVAREELTKLLGLWGNQAASYRIPARLPELPSDEVSLERLETAAISQRADLRAAKQQVQTLSYAASLASTTRWTGVISVGAEVARLKDGHIAVGPNASLELPIFDQRQAVVARIEAMQRAAKQTERALAIDIRSDVRRIRARVVASRRFAQRYKEVIVPARENVVRLSQIQYDAMLLSVYQLILSRQQEINAYREYVQSLRDYWIARSDLERAVGGRLSGAVPIVSSSDAAQQIQPPTTTTPPTDASHQHHH